MNRRNFIGNLLMAGAAFAILPGAGRIWKAQRVLPNPDYETAVYEVKFMWGDELYQATWTVRPTNPMILDIPLPPGELGPIRLVEWKSKSDFTGDVIIQ